MKVRIAVLSDLHFAPNEKGAKYTYMISTRDPIRKQNPYRDLLDLIQAESLSANMVLCPGDITLQADQSSLKDAWAALNNIQASLGATDLFAATGNHDISSRTTRETKTNPEIWESLKQLSPKYPHPQASREEWLQYWALHYSISVRYGVRIVSLNTCNSHVRGAIEYEKGRVTDFTISEIEREVATGGEHALNILLCHHHPVKHPDISQLLPDYSEMEQGRRLIERLERTGENWLVIHGHKHSPRIEYATGSTANTPVLFSAGSFSAVIPPTYVPGATNQFYILEFDLDYVRENGLAGTITAWDWTLGAGWQPSAPDRNESSRPVSGSGFGHRINVVQGARQIADQLGGRDQMGWPELTGELPWIRFLTYGDLEKILKKLREVHEIDSQRLAGEVFPRELLRKLQ